MPNPIAALCDACGPAHRRSSRRTNGHDRASIGAIRQQLITIPPGMDIVTEGVRSHGVFTVCDGWALRYQRLSGGTRQILDVLLPGDTIALASVLLGGNRHSVQALTSTRVCILNGRDIVALLKTNPAFAFGVLRSHAEEASRADTRLTMLGRMSAEEKVGYFMLEIYDRLRQRGMAERTSCPFPLRRLDVADAVGMSKVHVLRALRELRLKHLIETRRHDLIIPDVDRLADITGYRLA